MKNTPITRSVCYVFQFPASRQFLRSYSGFNELRTTTHKVDMYAIYALSPREAQLQLVQFLGEDAAGLKAVDLDLISE